MKAGEAWDGSDSYLANLTLGVTSVLEKLPGVQDVQLMSMPPCDPLAITAWEQRYTTSLPQALKDFYLSTDGFRLNWSYVQANQVLPVGIMNVNRLGDLRRLAGLRYNFESEQPTLLDIELGQTQDEPQFGLKWKIFELDNCEGVGKVCLVFPPRAEGTQIDEAGNVEVDFVPPDPQVWLLDRSFDWHFLAQGFLPYFRMMLVHLGLPQWQMRFTGMGPAPWAHGLQVLLAPHLDSETPQKQEYPTSEIDQNVFKVRSRAKRSTEKAAQEGGEERPPPEKTAPTTIS